MVETEPKHGETALRGSSSLAGLQQLLEEAFVMALAASSFGLPSRTCDYLLPVQLPLPSAAAQLYQYQHSSYHHLKEKWHPGSGMAGPAGRHRRGSPAPAAARQCGPAMRADPPASPEGGSAALEGAAAQAVAQALSRLLVSF